MRWPGGARGVAVWLAVLVGPAHAAEPMSVIIFSGGKSEADAKHALDSLEKLKPLMAKVVTLDGPPKVVESSKLPGLTAGFWVVTLGLCKSPAAALKAIKAVYPGAYSKPLTGDAGAESCPEVASDVKVAALDATLKAGGGAVSALSITDPSEDDRGHDTTDVTLHFVAVDKASGQVLDVAQTSGGGTGASGGEGPAGREYETCSATVRAEKAALVVVRDCTSERTACLGGEKAIPKAWTETERVTVSGGKLAVSKPKTTVTSSSSCSGGVYGD